jgi:hypothetical protein
VPPFWSDLSSSSSAAGGSASNKSLTMKLAWFPHRKWYRDSNIVYQRNLWDNRVGILEIRFRYYTDNVSAPPTYSSPNSQFYQPVPPLKDYSNLQSYQAYRQEADRLQELPADTTLPAGQRISELPGEAVSYRPHGISELPSSTTQVTAELETPQTSPDIQQGEFNNDLATRTNQTSDAAPGSAL